MRKIGFEKGRWDRFKKQGSPNVFGRGVDDKRHLFLKTVWFCAVLLIGSSFLLFVLFLKIRNSIAL